MTPNWLFTGKSVILVFQSLCMNFWSVWNIWTTAKFSLRWESLKQSRHFYSCYIHVKFEYLFTRWFDFRRYCTSFGGNSQRYKLWILWSLSKTLNRGISNDRGYGEYFWMFEKEQNQYWDGPSYLVKVPFGFPDGLRWFHMVQDGLRWSAVEDGLIVQDSSIGSEIVQDDW